MRNAELDIKWSGGLGTAAAVAPAVQRPPLQLIYIKLCVARQRYVFRYIGRIQTHSLDSATSFAGWQVTCHVA